MKPKSILLHPNTKLGIHPAGGSSASSSLFITDSTRLESKATLVL